MSGDVRSSVLGNDMCGIEVDSMENTFTDDTTLFNSDLSDLKLDRAVEVQRRRSLGRNSSEKKRRVKIEEDVRFGFENKAFVSQHIYPEPVRYCSLAQFVEGNDIARKSFKRPRKTSKTETNINRQSALLEEGDRASIKGESSTFLLACVCGTTHSLNENRFEDEPEQN